MPIHHMHWATVWAVEIFRIRICRVYAYQNTRVGGLRTGIWLIFFTTPYSTALGKRRKLDVHSHICRAHVENSSYLAMHIFYFNWTCIISANYWLDLWNFIWRWYLDTWPKNDVISFSRKRFCVLRLRLELGLGLAEIRFPSTSIRVSVLHPEHLTIACLLTYRWDALCLC